MPSDGRQAGRWLRRNVRTVDLFVETSPDPRIVRRVCASHDSRQSHSTTTQPSRDRACRRCPLRRARLCFRLITSLAPHQNVARDACVHRVFGKYSTSKPTGAQAMHRASKSAVKFHSGTSDLGAERAWLPRIAAPGPCWCRRLHDCRDISLQGTFATMESSGIGIGLCRERFGWIHTVTVYRPNDCQPRDCPRHRRRRLAGRHK